MLLKAHEDLNPFLLTRLNHLIKDRIIFPLHKLPINIMSIVGDFRLSTSNDGCGVIILLKYGPKSVICSSPSLIIRIGSSQIHHSVRHPCLIIINRSSLEG
jgi:hypothetical protein